MGKEHETDQGGAEGGEVVRKATLWSCSQDDEVLTHTDPYDAVTDWLENCYPGELVDVPDMVTVYGFAPMPITHTCGYESWAVENLLESLDEEYGNMIDGDPTEPSKRMLRAAKVFVARVIRDYHVWTCEQVCAEQHPTNVKERFA